MMIGFRMVGICGMSFDSHQKCMQNIDRNISLLQVNTIDRKLIILHLHLFTVIYLVI